MEFSSRELIFCLTSSKRPSDSCVLFKITFVILVTYGGVVRTEPDALSEKSI